MEYFKSGLKSVLGAPQDDQQPSAAETVDRLVERVQTSTLLDDRRDACRALKALSGKFRLEIGAQAMDPLIHVLESDRTDNEIISYSIDAICNVINGPRDDENPECLAINGDDLGLQFTEIFTKKTENVSLLLEILEEYDFKVRFPIVRLLSGLLKYKPKDLQECILVSPMGVSRLMDLLSDTRDIIRNETLLLLEHLTKNNANIQKIVAFENGFDKLFQVIAAEGYSDGGLIVGDCLRVLLTLLKNNTSNQTFFKEGSYIKHLTPFFDLQDIAERGWNQHKTMNTLTMFQVVRVLVSPNNPPQVTAAAQKAMHQSGLLEQLCYILMALGIPADVLTETINTVAEIIRGNHNNQEYFSTVNAPTSPPKPALVVLLMSMVNDKQPFNLRCSVLYCFQCFLYRNELGQAQVVQTLLPSTADVTTVTMGQLLCGGLFSADPVSNWFAAVALSHALVDNPTQKEQLLRVQLATSVGNPAISLINQCAMMLQQGGRIQTRLGLLLLMSTWLANCTLAVMQFLSIPTNIPFLTSQVCLGESDEHEDLVQGICAFVLGICIEFNDNSQPSFTKDDLTQLIAKRIGLEAFLGKLVAVTKNENYSRAAQNPHLKFKHSSEMLFDFEFCRLFKSLEATIIKATQPKVLNGPETLMTPEQQELLGEYKEIIRDQDQQLHDLKAELTETKTNYESSKTSVEEMTKSIQQLKDQIALFKAQRSVSGNSSSQEVSQLKLEIEQLKEECNKKNAELENKTIELNQKACESAGLFSNPSDNHFTLDHSSSHEKCQQEIDTLNEELKNSREKVQALSLAASSTSSQASELSNLFSTDHSSGHEKCQKEIDSLKKELKQALFVAQSSPDYKAENARLKDERDSIEDELNSLKKEQEDVLILLTEQSDRIADYKKRLKELGQTVEDDDDDDDDLNDEDSDDMGNGLNELKDDAIQTRNEIHDASSD